MTTDLKPCPFCGAYPRLLCDLRDWRGYPVYGKFDGNRPISYELQANHKQGCYIRGMDGRNSEGRTSAMNWECLVNSWNRRFNDESDTSSTR